MVFLKIKIRYSNCLATIRISQFRDTGHVGGKTLLEEQWPIYELLF